MIIEYSNEVRGGIYAYRFSKGEMKIIAKSLKPMIKKLGNKIAKITNHPNNEGQATYACQIEDLRGMMEALNEIIEHFESNN